MNDGYENQLIREATGELPWFEITEPETEATMPRTEMAQQGETKCLFFQHLPQRKKCVHCGKTKAQH